MKKRKRGGAPHSRTRAKNFAEAIPVYSNNEERDDLSGYRSMWLFAMFDLPVDDKEARKRYARFRKDLLCEGFSRLQYSVYARHCPSEESSETIRARLRHYLPSEGHVRLLGVTDRQFGKMEVFYGKKSRKAEDAPRQFMLF